MRGDLPWKEHQRRGLHLGPTFTAVFQSPTHIMAPMDDGIDRTLCVSSPFWEVGSKRRAGQKSEGAGVVLRSRSNFCLHGFLPLPLPVVSFLGVPGSRPVIGHSTRRHQHCI